MYEFNTCGSGCDTKLWIYDYCNMGSFDNTNRARFITTMKKAGAMMGELPVLLEGGAPVWIRMGLGSPDYASLVDLESQWSYHDQGEDLGSEWTAADYDDADWDLEMRNWDTVMEMKRQRYHTATTHRTSTLRRTSVTLFEYTGESGSGMEGLLRLRRDDGAVVYLNGVEIMRSNMPDGFVNSETDSVERNRRRERIAVVRIPRRLMNNG